MKISKYWNNGCPTVAAHYTSLDDAVEAKAAFSSHYGCQIGSINKYRPTLVTCGNAAVEFLKFVGDTSGYFSAWVPKFCAKKYLRLPDAYFVNDAKKYSTRKEWIDGADSTYQHVHNHRRHLLEECCAHMRKNVGPLARGYQVYAYEFSDNSAYVGITCNPERRHKDHSARGPVYRKASQGIVFTLKVLADSLPPSEAASREVSSIKHYADTGWSILNTKDGGSLGQITFKHSYDALLLASKEYSSRTAWNNANSGEYQAACLRRWIDRISEENGWPKHATHWTYQECLASAKVYESSTAWTLHDKRAYLSAWRNGWLPRIAADRAWPAFKCTTAPRWTQEACASDAARFPDFLTWKRERKVSVYKHARMGGWLPRICRNVFGLDASEVFNGRSRIQRSVIAVCAKAREYV